MAITTVATCGLICDICIGFQRKKNKCPGCCKGDGIKPCSILACPEKQGSPGKSCNACAKFPCRRLKSLEKRYTSKYGESLMENFRRIEALGLEKLMLEAEVEWTCPGCGALHSVHRDKCLLCGALNSRYGSDKGQI